MLVLILAFLIRILGVNFGLPEFFFHIDETTTYRRAENLFNTDYSSIIFHGPMRLLSNYFELSEILLIERVLSAILSTLSVYLTYQVVNIIFGKKHRALGLLSSLFLSLSFVDVQSAHYMKQGVYIQVLTLLIILFSLKALKNKSWLLPSSFLVGLTASIKYNGVFFGICLLIPILNYLKKTTSIKIKFLFLFTLSSLFFLGFWLGTPPYYLKPLAFFTEYFQFIFNFLFKAAPNQAVQSKMSSFAWWNLYLMRSGLYYFFYIFSLSGLIVFVYKSIKEKLDIKLFLIWLPTLLYLLLLFVRKDRYDRYVTLITPMLAIFAGYFFVFIKKLKLFKSSSVKKITGFFLLIIFTIMFLRIILLDISMLVEDTREKAYDWIKQNVAKDRVIFMIGSTGQLGQKLKEQGFAQTLNFYSLKNEIFDYAGEFLVISSSDYRLAKNYSHQSDYSNFWQNYQTIRQYGEPVKSFDNPIIDDRFFSPYYLEHGSTVNAYHNPKIEIYKIPEIEGYSEKIFVYEYLTEKMQTFSNLILKKDNKDEYLLKNFDQFGGISGPHIVFPKGDYELSYKLDNIQCQEEAKVYLKVFSSGRLKEYGAKDFDCRSLVYNLTPFLEFNLNQASRLELVLEMAPGIAGRIYGAKIIEKENIKDN